MDEFMLLAMLLAGINALPPLLFFVYLFTKGKTMRFAVHAGQVANTVLFVGGVEHLWMGYSYNYNLIQRLCIENPSMRQGPARAARRWRRAMQ